MIACALQLLELVEGEEAMCNKWRGIQRLLAGVFDYIFSIHIALGQTRTSHNVLVMTCNTTINGNGNNPQIYTSQ